MANPDLLTKLYQRMSAEQEQYRNWLLGQPPGVILDHAAEYTVREDIVMEMEELELTDAQTKALLKSKTPLADVCREWNKTETHHIPICWRLTKRPSIAWMYSCRSWRKRRGPPRI